MINTPTASLILTGAVAVVTLYIAWQQKQTAKQLARTAENKLRLDLFDRRLPVYEAAITLANYIVSTGGTTHEKASEFSQACKSARFLFNEEMQNYCAELHNEALCVFAGKVKVDGYPVGSPERDQSLALLNERILWFQEQLKTEIAKRFGAFLHIQG